MLPVHVLPPRDAPVHDPVLPGCLLAGISEKIDIYSLAMVLYECTTGHRPWEGLSNYAVIYKVGAGCVGVLVDVSACEPSRSLHQRSYTLPEGTNSRGH